METFFDFVLRCSRPRESRVTLLSLVHPDLSGSQLTGWISCLAEDQEAAATTTRNKSRFHAIRTTAHPAQMHTRAKPPGNRFVITRGGVGRAPSLFQATLQWPAAQLTSTNTPNNPTSKVRPLRNLWPPRPGRLLACLVAFSGPATQRPLRFSGGTYPFGPPGGSSVLFFLSAGLPEAWSWEL